MPSGSNRAEDSPPSSGGAGTFYLRVRTYQKTSKPPIFCAENRRFPVIVGNFLLGYQLHTGLRLSVGRGLFQFARLCRPTLTLIGNWPIIHAEKSCTAAFCVFGLKCAVVWRVRVVWSKSVPLDLWRSCSGRSGEAVRKNIFTIRTKVPSWQVT